MAVERAVQHEHDMSFVTDPIEAAEAAGLRHVSDDQPGFRRSQDGAGVYYVDTNGKRITAERQLQRIRSLGIPPAWTDVWICPRANGHIQATGRDARGRKQYRYHPEWRKTRDETKYGRIMIFGQMLPALRQRVDDDLRLPGLPRAKVLATLVRLLETTLIRVGNDEYARTNRSYGLTTMRDRHVDVAGSTITFSFRGKSGKRHTISVNDRRMAAIVRRCRDLPGQELFQYVDEHGNHHTIDSGDVNAYLREATGEQFTAKDFRTWAGTLLAAQTLRALEPFESEAQAKRQIVRAIEEVSRTLGNTPTICRKCYVHPAVLEAHLEGTLVETLQQRADDLAEDEQALEPEERDVLHFLRLRLGAAA